MTVVPSSEGGRSYAQSTPMPATPATETGVAVSGHGYTANAFGEVGVVVFGFVVVAIVMGYVFSRFVDALTKR